MWIVYAVLSALFSALVAIFIKLGLTGMNSNFATAIRTSMVMVVTWLFAFWVGGWSRESVWKISREQLLYLFLSALATGGAWLCYNRALQDGPATRVASVDKLSIVLVALLSWLVFREHMGWQALVGIALMVTGTVILVFAK